MRWRSSEEYKEERKRGKKRVDRFDRPRFQDGGVFFFAIRSMRNETNAEIIRRMAVLPTNSLNSANVWYAQWWRYAGYDCAWNDEIWKFWKGNYPIFSFLLRFFFLVNYAYFIILHISTVLSVHLYFSKRISISFKFNVHRILSIKYDYIFLVHHLRLEERY